MDGELKFHNHVAQAAKKASGVLAQIRRTMGPWHVTMKLLSLYSTKELFVPYLNTPM